jgi:hypothetical protein
MAAGSAEIGGELVRERARSARMRALYCRVVS